MKLLIFVISSVFEKMLNWRDQQVDDADERVMVSGITTTATISPSQTLQPPAIPTPLLLSSI